MARLRLVPPAQRAVEIRESFTPWYSDPIRLARLYRFLCLSGKPPVDPASFMESAQDWVEDYRALCEIEGLIA